MEYTLKDHRHHFSIWTAARAVQRSWTTTLKVSLVIHAVQLSDFADTYTRLSGQKDFDDKHVHLCERMIEEFRLLNVEATYGRVAKIMAVYLKTSVILGANVDHEKIRLIHPPIDRIVLRNLPSNVNFGDVRTLNWTQLNKEAYWRMVGIIRDRLGIFDWRLEMLWRPERDRNGCR